MTDLACLLVTTLLWTQSAPATASAETTDAEVTGLIRDLNNPKPARRKAAAARLTEIGDDAEVILKKVKPDQPVEAQLAINQILHDIRLLRRGVLVLLVVSNSAAALNYIEPGDVFLAANGKPITDADAWSKAEEAGLRNQSRTVRIRRGSKTFERQFRAGRYGIYWCEYQAGWGDHLVEAARRHNAYDYASAAAAIDQAIEAGKKLGIDVEKTRGLAGFIALCRYYARPPAQRAAYMETLLSTSPYNDCFRDIISLAMSCHPEDQHLPDALCRRLMTSDEKVIWPAEQLIYRMVHHERRYAEALPELAGLARSWDERTPEERANWLHLTAACLNALGADAELSVALDRLAAFPEGRARFAWLLPAAIRIGRLELCQTVLPQIPEEITAEGRDGLWEYHFAKDRLYQVYLRQGHVDEYRQALAEGLAGLSFAQDSRQYMAYWRQTGDLWGRRAEELLEEGSVMNLDFLLSAFAFQIDPDLAKFDQAIRRCESLRPKPFGAALHRSRLQALKGDYAASLKWYETIRVQDEKNRPWNKPWDVGAETEAVRFLAEHAKSLTGQDEKWRRALYAYKTDDGTRYLITRDIRIGKASPEGKVIEIPLPEPGWWPYRLADGLIVSASGRTVLAVNREKVYQLKPDATGWSPLMDIPFSQRGWAVHKLAPWADELAAEMQSLEPHGRFIALPEEFPDYNKPKPIEPLMLGDGTWLFCQEEPRRLFNLTAVLAEKLGRRVHIYNCFRAKDGPFYLATEEGLYRWAPDSDQFAPVPLPGPTSTPPIMIIDERLSYAADPQPIVAVLPHAGGAIFRLDLKLQEAIPIPRINERMPASYWPPRPPTERIAEAKAALNKASLSWAQLLPPPE